MMSLMLTTASTQKESPPTNSLRSPDTDKTIVKAAMLPMTFQDWSKLSILCGILFV